MGRDMDSIHLTACRSVRDGLQAMMELMVGQNDWVYPSVEISTALLIVEVAKRAPDRDGFFPHGKWATIQAIQGRINKQLDKMEEESTNAQ